MSSKILKIPEYNLPILSRSDPVPVLSGPKLKVDCVFRMIIWPKFSMGQNRHDDHREDAPHFIYVIYLYPLKSHLYYSKVNCSISFENWNRKTVLINAISREYSHTLNTVPLETSNSRLNTVISNGSSIFKMISLSLSLSLESTFRVQPV